MDIAAGGHHDCAVCVGPGIPSDMLFVRNQNGRHNPADHKNVQDFAKASDGLAAWVIANLGASAV